MSSPTEIGSTIHTNKPKQLQVYITYDSIISY